MLRLVPMTESGGTKKNMAHITVEMTSVTLNTQVEIHVILPTEIPYQRLGEPIEDLYKRETYRVLYFLHGAIASGAQILRYTGMERYAEENRTAVVLPYCGNGFYTNMRYGENYYDFIVKELPCMVHKLFPLSEKREDTYIAGLSMGGYGALKIGLLNPERFAGIASLSGVLDIQKEIPVMKRMGLPMERVFGDLRHLAGTDADILELLKKRAQERRVPSIYQAVGTEDFLYEANQTFRALCREQQIENYIYDEGLGGHDWNFWDFQIKRVLEWMRKGGKEK